MKALKPITASVILIGNEILSGRTQDRNLKFFGKEFGKMGIQLLDGRIIPDYPESIVKTVVETRKNHDYVITTGGIGPTHDDITAHAIAKAFNVKLMKNAQAESALRNYYSPSQDFTPERRKMAMIPQGAHLIPNTISAAPGFYIENVFTLAGVPRIARAMFKEIKPLFRTGHKIHSQTLSAYLKESQIAAGVHKIQKAYPMVEIGSYPFSSKGRPGTSIVAHSTDITALQDVMGAVQDFMENQGQKPFVKK